MFALRGTSRLLFRRLRKLLFSHPHFNQDFNKRKKSIAFNIFLVLALRGTNRFLSRGVRKLLFSHPNFNQDFRRDGLSPLCGSDTGLTRSVWHRNLARGVCSSAAAGSALSRGLVGSLWLDDLTHRRMRTRSKIVNPPFSVCCCCKVVANENLKSSLPGTF